MSESETLVIVSKLKKYIKENSGMNTAGNVAPALSDQIRQMCNRAIESAKSDGRKTIMDRDFASGGGE
jgi:histone H3/H4